MPDIKCFIINLEKDIQKKKQMNYVCQKNSFTPTFIKAIYGKELTKEYIRSVANQSMAKKYLGRELALGEIGVALSQLSIYQEMIENDIEVALVLEDDVNFTFNPHQLTKIVAQFPLNWECVMLGHHTKRSRVIDTLESSWNQKKLSEKYKLVRFAENPIGAYGYLINLAGAHKMLSEYEIIYKPIDDWDDKKLNIYGVIPSMIVVDEIFIDDSLLLQERQKVVEYRTTYQSFKDKIQWILKKLKLYNIYFSIRNIFLKIKKISSYDINSNK